jgi:hypothetical protein
MKIDEETLQAYSAKETIIHCLWEMTFCGYSTEEISEQRAELLRRANEVRRKKDGQ